MIVLIVKNSQEVLQGDQAQGGQRAETTMQTLQMQRSVAPRRGEFTTRATLERGEPEDLQGSRGTEPCTRRNLVHRSASHGAIGARTTGVKSEEHGTTSTLVRGNGISS